MKYNKLRLPALLLLLCLLLSACSSGGRGEAEDANLGRWLRALAALPMSELQGNLQVFGGELTEETALAALAVRGIDSREGLLQAVAFRVREGLRAEYLFDREMLSAYQPQELEGALAALDEAMARHYRAVLAVAERWDERGLLALDAAEAALLAQLGCRAGLLTEEEAQALGQPVAEMVLGSFASFEELLQNQVDARLVTDGLTREDPAFAALEAQAAALSAAEDPERPVLDDGLFSEGLLPLEGMDGAALLGL